MLSSLVLQNLLHSQEYWRRALPYLKSEYFDHPGERILFSSIEAYSNKYKSQPTLDALAIEANQAIGDVDSGGIAKAVDEALGAIATLDGEVQSTEWLVDKTEEFCKEQALHNALRKAIQVLNGEDKEITKGMLPKLLDEALGITFDHRIGHDYLEDWEERWDELHRTSSRIPFDIEFLNKITKGGIFPKTLTCFMAACVHPDTPVKLRIRKK